MERTWTRSCPRRSRWFGKPPCARSACATSTCNWWAGVALHQGKIAEMRTGEGKTLVATLNAYLNALSGKGVHIVTVNDYLAQRDADWMGPIYQFLELTVGVVKAGQSREDKQEAYKSDITYGTNNEFGFDYLRDNLAIRLEDRVQRELNYAIVDEVDCILIDEARTPLIISGPSTESTELYLKINKLIPRLTPSSSASRQGQREHRGQAGERHRRIRRGTRGNVHRRGAGTRLRRPAIT